VTLPTSPLRLSAEQVDAYLRRLGLGPSCPPNLNALHAAHLRAVPFENLDIHEHRSISLELGDV